jgi:Tfp pilus assembly protein PilV
VVATRQAGTPGNGQDPEAGSTLIEVLVAMLLVALVTLTFTSVVVQVGRYSNLTVSANQARQINQDVLGYLVAAPTNVIDAVAPVDADAWTPAPTNLHVSKARLPGYTVGIKVLSAASAGLQGQNVEVQAQTCYTPPDTSTPQCATGSVVRPDADLSITPPTGLARSTVACDGRYTADNACTPLLAAARQSTGTVLLTVTGPQPGKHGQPDYTIQRARDPGFTTAVTNIDATSLNTTSSATDHPTADQAHDENYSYRVEYSYPGYASVWSQTATVTVPAAHPACPADPAMTSASECTPTLSTGSATPDKDPTQLDIPLLATGPADQVTYTIQKLRRTAGAPTPTATDWATATQTTLTATGPRPSLPPDVEPYSTDPANPDEWFYRISYGVDDHGKTIWSIPAPFVVPGK